LNTSTSDTAGNEADPSATLAIGTPSSTLLANMPPSANTDCATPSMPKIQRPANRPIAYTIRQLPKNAASSIVSTGGRREKSDISPNSRAGMATANTNCVRASDTDFDQPPQRVSR
jgi:hypothetical protein